MYVTAYEMDLRRQSSLCLIESNVSLELGSGHFRQSKEERSAHRKIQSTEHITSDIGQMNSYLCHG